MRNAISCMALLLLLAIGCGQAVESESVALPAGAQLITLDLPGMT